VESTAGFEKLHFFSWHFVCLSAGGMIDPKISQIIQSHSTLWLEHVFTSFNCLIPAMSLGTFDAELSLL